MLPLAGDRYVGNFGVLLEQDDWFFLSGILAPIVAQRSHLPIEQNPHRDSLAICIVILQVSFRYLVEPMVGGERNHLGSAAFEGLLAFATAKPTRKTADRTRKPSKNAAPQAIHPHENAPGRKIGIKAQIDHRICGQSGVLSDMKLPVPLPASC